MVAPFLCPRLAEARLVEALADTPVVLVHGPPQCGKTTLAQRVGRRRGCGYFTFDDSATLAAATADPVGRSARRHFRAQQGGPAWDSDQGPGDHESPRRCAAGARSGPQRAGASRTWAVTLPRATDV